MASVSATTSSDAHRASASPSFGATDRRALVPYVTAGHPDVARSVALLQGLEAAGADVIEVGVPFSDPMADGPVIQASSQRALEHGVHVRPACSRSCRERRSRMPGRAVQLPEPAARGGADALERAADAGAHGVLVTDLPVGADPEREAWFGDGPLAFVRLVAPTTPQERMREIARARAAASSTSSADWA